jgi:hypothetical protein
MHRLKVLVGGGAHLLAIYWQLADSGSNKREHESQAEKGQAERKLCATEHCLLGVGLLYFTSCNHATRTI